VSTDFPSKVDEWEVKKCLNCHNFGWCNKDGICNECNKLEKV